MVTKPMNRLAVLSDKFQTNPCAACPVRQLALCAALSDTEIGALDAISTTVTHTAGATILREGEPAESVYNLVSGYVKLYKLLVDGRRQISGFLMPGDFVGIAHADLHNCSAEAIGPVVLCGFSRVRLEALMDECPNLQHAMLSMVSNELIEAREHAVLLGRKTARERVCSFLLSVARRAGQTERSATGALQIALPMTRCDMADYLGLTIETVSRVLGDLKRRGVICLPARSIVEIPSVERLETLADQA